MILPKQVAAENKKSNKRGKNICMDIWKWRPVPSQRGWVNKLQK